MFPKHAALFTRKKSTAYNPLTMNIIANPPINLAFNATAPNIAAFSTKAVPAATTKVTKVQGAPTLVLTELVAPMDAGGAAYPGTGINDGTDTYQAGYSPQWQTPGQGEQFVCTLADTTPIWVYMPGTTYAGRLRFSVTILETDGRTQTLVYNEDAATSDTTLHRFMECKVVPAKAGAVLTVKGTQETNQLTPATGYNGSFYGILLRTAVLP